MQVGPIRQDEQGVDPGDLGRGNLHALHDGRVDGDNISFSINANFQGNDVKLNYKGKVVGDHIKLTVEIPDAGQTAEYDIEKVS